MFACMSQKEAELYAKGRRDGYHGYAHESSEPVYLQGVRAGMLEKLTA